MSVQEQTAVLRMAHVMRTSFRSRARTCRIVHFLWRNRTLVFIILCSAHLLRRRMMPLELLFLNTSLPVAFLRGVNSWPALALKSPSRINCPPWGGIYRQVQVGV